MESKQINIVIRLIVILGTIFCIISLLTPWSGSAFTFGIFKENYSAPFYINFFTDQTIHDSNYFNQAVFFGFSMIIIFILTIGALIYGLMCVRKPGEEPPSSFILISVLLIINIILYIIVISIWTENSSHIGSNYSIGFITALISFILFFISFIIKSVFHKDIKSIEKIKSENELINILKTRYAKGEITKEQFEQMKKDLEG